jgi:sugar phosphate permease
MDDNLGRKVLSYRWLIFGIMASAYLAAFFHRVCPAVIALDIQETYGISAELIGLLASAYFYGYAFIQFPAGLLSDSFGPRKSVTLFVIVGALGSILFGLAPNLETALVGRVLVGLGAGMVFTPTMKILSSWFRVNEFTKMNAILLATGGLGALSAAAPLALVTGWLGWRSAFELIGGSTLVLGALLWFLVRDRPQDFGWPSLAKIDPIYGQSLAPRRKIGLWEGARRVLGEKYFWPIAGWSFFTMGAFFSFGGLWAGPYLMHVYGMTRAEAGGVLNMLALGILLGSPLLAFLSEKVFYSRRNVLRLCSAILVVELILMNLFPADAPIPILYAMFLIFAACSLAPGVMSITTTKELFPIEITGTSVGTVNLFPFVGGAVMQLVAGRTLDAYPKGVGDTYSLEAYSAMLGILLVAASIGLVCAFLMKETYSDQLRNPDVK